MNTIDQFNESKKGQLVIVVTEGQEAPPFEIMAGDQWIELRKTPDGYTYAHEVRCEGIIVAVFGFRTDSDETPVLGRFERNPAHNVGKYPDFYDIPHELASITGGLEPDMTPEETAVLEMKEEGGYDITVDELHDLGTVRPSKGMDTVVHLYAVDLTGRHQGEAMGDGSQGEEDAYCDWISEEDALNCKDALMQVMMARFYGLYKTERE